MVTAPNAERGTTLVESCIAIMLIMSLIAGVMSGTYLGFSRVWVRQTSYEGAICLARDEAVSKCRSDIQARINGVLIGEPLTNLQLRRSKRVVEVSFDITVMGNWRATETRRLKLPLRDRSEIL